MSTDSFQKWDQFQAKVSIFWWEKEIHDRKLPWSWSHQTPLNYMSSLTCTVRTKYLRNLISFPSMTKIIIPLSQEFFQTCLLLTSTFPYHIINSKLRTHLIASSCDVFRVIPGCPWEWGTFSCATYCKVLPWPLCTLYNPLAIAFLRNRL